MFKSDLGQLVKQHIIVFFRIPAFKTVRSSPPVGYGVNRFGLMLESLYSRSLPLCKLKRNVFLGSR